MSDKKISQLTALTGANTAADDVLAIVDTNAAETKKITREEFFKNIQTNVGIGTSSPSQQLHIRGTSGTSVETLVENTSEGSSASGSIRTIANSTANAFLRTYGTGVTASAFGVTLANYSALLSDGASSNGLIVGSATSDPVIFGTNALERMRIDSSGNVAIGATSTSVFRVAGASFNAKSVISLSSTGTTINTEPPTLLLQNTASVTQGQMSRIAFSAVSGLGVPIVSADITAVYTGNATGNGRSSALVFGTNEQTIGQTPVERMRIDSSGNLLVGTTSTTGAANNVTKVVGGIFSTANGNAPSLTTGTATTIFTLTNTAQSQTWLVSADLISESTTSYSCLYVVTLTNANTVQAVQVVKGSLASISVSGLNVQYTQSSGGTKTNGVWSAVRIM